MRLEQIILSMILPAYNVEKYIEKCIESCERQDIPKNNYEIIVVNDGSTDGTLCVVESLVTKYSNIRIVNQPNQGVSVARNNGFKEAQGKYIWFIDPDDEISSNCLSSLISIMENQNLEALVVAPCIPYTTEFPSLGNGIKPYVSETCSGVEFLLDKTNFAVAPWCFIFLNSFWRNGKFSFKPGIRYEDSELIPYVTSKVTRLAKLTQFSCYNYIQHDASFMHSKVTRNHILSIAVLINSYMSYATETDIKDLKLYFRENASASFVDGINKISKWDGDKWEMYEEFMQAIKVRPRDLYADSFLKKFYQYIILNWPKLYIRTSNLIYGK